MCFRVTQDHWDLQDLKERMEKGYKASADTDVAGQSLNLS